MSLDLRGGAPHPDIAPGAAAPHDDLHNVTVTWPDDEEMMPDSTCFRFVQSGVMLTWSAQAATVNADAADVEEGIAETNERSICNDIFRRPAVGRDADVERGAAAANAAAV